jgi:hypothetical protein
MPPFMMAPQPQQPQLQQQQQQQQQAQAPLPAQNGGGARGEARPKGQRSIADFFSRARK